MTGGGVLQGHASTAEGLKSLLEAALALLAAAYLLMLAYVSISRLTWPFELEWMEGAAVVHVERTLAGLPIYAEPSLHFIAYIYTPFYWYVSALSAAVFGNGFFALRVVSVLSSVFCLGFIYLVVRRRNGSKFAALLSMGLFAASYKITGAWMDLARVDSLFLALLLAGVWTFDSSRPFSRSIISPVLFFLAFFTKQPAAIAIAALSISSLTIRKGMERVAFPAVSAALIALSLVIMNQATDGWYQWYILDIPSRHEVYHDMLMFFWTKDLGKWLPIALIIAAYSAVSGGLNRSAARNHIGDICLFGGLLITAYLGRVHSGGAQNTLFPVAAGIAVFFGTGYDELQRRFHSRPGSALFVTAIAVVQFLRLVWNPVTVLPTEANLKAGQDMLAELSKYSGEVFMPDNSWYPRMLSKPAQAHSFTSWDIFRARGLENWKSILQTQADAAVEDEKYDVMVITAHFITESPSFSRKYVEIEAPWLRKEIIPFADANAPHRRMFVRRSSSAGVSGVP